jgi:hypothetical protein
MPKTYLGLMFLFQVPPNPRPCKDILRQAIRVSRIKKGQVMPVIDKESTIPKKRKKVRKVYRKACFPPHGKFIRASREKSNVIGWRHILTTSPANHVRVFLVGAKKIWPSGKPV